LAWDKLQHAAAYGVGTLVTGRLFVFFARSELRGWIWAVICIVLYGVLIEFAQGLFSEVRQAEFSDIVADAVGSLLVLAMVAGWHIVRRGRPGRNRR
jgi:VanZ family protein